VKPPAVRIARCSWLYLFDMMTVNKIIDENATIAIMIYPNCLTLRRSVSAIEECEIESTSDTIVSCGFKQEHLIHKFPQRISRV
jgi:hypothetical protein